MKAKKTNKYTKNTGFYLCFTAVTTHPWITFFHQAKKIEKAVAQVFFSLAHNKNYLQLMYDEEKNDYTLGKFVASTKHYL